MNLMPPRREIRADQLLAHVLHVIDKYIPNSKDGRRHMHRELSDLFFTAGAYIVTDADRANAGLEMRDHHGLTLEELKIIESRQIMAMLSPIKPFVVDGPLFTPEELSAIKAVHIDAAKGQHPLDIAPATAEELAIGIVMRDECGRPVPYGDAFQTKESVLDAVEPKPTEAERLANWEIIRKARDAVQPKKPSRFKFDRKAFKWLA